MEIERCDENAKLVVQWLLPVLRVTEVGLRKQLGTVWIAAACHIPFPPFVRPFHPDQSNYRKESLVFSYSKKNKRVFDLNLFNKPKVLLYEQGLLD